MNPPPSKILVNIYQRLFKAFGPQKWWPADTPFEVIVGAILTQNTNWRNVEKAIQNLKHHKGLSLKAIQSIRQDTLAEWIKPSGFFNIKASRLKNFVSFVYDYYQGELSLMAQEDIVPLRKELLRIKGVGPETADSILLYAFNKPIFVVDAYTKRIFSRHGIVSEDDLYHSVQDVFMSGLKPDRELFNEYHALIVRLAKNYCRTMPLCEGCPLASLL